MEKIHSLLGLLDLSLPERKVYLSLLQEGAASARTLALRTGITRTSIYDQLSHLIQLGLVVAKDINGTNTYTLNDLEQVSRLLEEKRQKFDQGKQEILPLLTSLQNQSEASSPKIRFVHGEANVSRLLYEMLFTGHKKICTVWPYEEMCEIVSREFLEKFNYERKRKNITLLALWPHKYKKTKTLFDEKDQTDHTMQRRYSPKGFSPSMSYTICGPKVFCVSSRKEMYGFVVDSAEFADLMQQQFDSLWDTAN